MRFILILSIIVFCTVNSFNADGFRPNINSETEATILLNHVGKDVNQRMNISGEDYSYKATHRQKRSTWIRIIEHLAAAAETFHVKPALAEGIVDMEDFNKHFKSKLRDGSKSVNVMLSEDAGDGKKFPQSYIDTDDSKVSTNVESEVDKEKLLKPGDMYSIKKEWEAIKNLHIDANQREIAILEYIEDKGLDDLDEDELNSFFKVKYSDAEAGSMKKELVGLLDKIKEIRKEIQKRDKSIPEEIKPDVRTRDYELLKLHNQMRGLKQFNEKWLAYKNFGKMMKIKILIKKQRKLSTQYNEVKRKEEELLLSLTNSDWKNIDFEDFKKSKSEEEDVNEMFSKVAKPKDEVKKYVKEVKKMSEEVRESLEKVSAKLQGESLYDAENFDVIFNNEFQDALKFVKIPSLRDLKFKKTLKKKEIESITKEFDYLMKLHLSVDNKERRLIEEIATVDEDNIDPDDVAYLYMEMSISCPKVRQILVKSMALHPLEKDEWTKTFDEIRKIRARLNKRNESLQKRIKGCNLGEVLDFINSKFKIVNENNKRWLVHTLIREQKKR